MLWRLEQAIERLLPPRVHGQLSVFQIVVDHLPSTFFCLGSPVLKSASKLIRIKDINSMENFCLQIALVSPLVPPQMIHEGCTKPLLVVISHIAGCYLSIL